MRFLDHFVLVARSIADARKCYTRMGFNVAPDGVHPFGTHNANMYFHAGAMIETLAVENQAKYKMAIESGNTFVKNDAAFRNANGEHGFSHIVFTSINADIDHKKFSGLGFSGGDIVSFSRQFSQPDGKVETVAAKLCFATHPKSHCGYYFTCEDIIVPEIDRSSLLEHENGALGPNHAISCSNKPSEYFNFLKSVVDPNKVQNHGESVECEFPNGRALIVTPQVLEQEFGMAHTNFGTDLIHRGLVFGVDDLRKTEALFARNEIPFMQCNDRIVAQPEPQNGVFFAFEQS
ncbi:MAG: VOC family protein [Pseudomonadota bacterium]